MVKNVLVSVNDYEQQVSLIIISLKINIKYKQKYLNK